MIALFVPIGSVQSVADVWLGEMSSVFLSVEMTSGCFFCLTCTIVDINPILECHAGEQKSKKLQISVHVYFMRKR